MKKVVKSIAWLVVLGILFSITYLYWQHNKLYPSTDDAYIQANIINITPQVSGKIIGVYVEDNAAVKKGQPLFQIDPEPFLLTVKQLRAELENTRQEVNASEDAVEAAQALVAERRAQLIVNQKNERRIAELVKQHLYPISEGDEVLSELRVAEAGYKAAISQLQESKQKLGEPGEANANIQAAKAMLAQAKLNLYYTRVAAPKSGTLNNFTLRVGTIVTAQQPLFALIENDEWWVEANFKETELEHIHPGQSATIKLDMYPTHDFIGVVQSVSKGSGAAFSLLPPENATGNWVKITQRFPVRISLKDSDKDFPLRVGASTKVIINTTTVNQ